MGNESREHSSLSSQLAEASYKVSPFRFHLNAFNTLGIVMRLSSLLATSRYKKSNLTYFELFLKGVIHS